MGALPEVAEVAPPVRSKDGTALRVTVVMKGAELDARKNVVPLLDRTAQVAEAHPDLIVEETGSPAISKGVNDQRGEDLALSERLSLPVTLVILLIVFGSVVMAGVPLLLALSSIAATMGLAMLASHLMPDPGVGTNMILLMGLAVGVDYTLFYLKREREERSRAALPPQLRGARGTRRGDRGPGRRGLRPRRDRLHRHPLPGHRRHLLLAGDRHHPRGRRGRPQLAHRAARAPREARPPHRTPCREEGRPAGRAGCAGPYEAA